MSISRTYLGGWGVNEKLTSAQMNAIDIALAGSLDKRAGQTDTLDSIITLGTAGRMLPSVATGTDGNTTINPGNGNTVVRVTSAVTASRTYTLGTTGVQTNDVITIYAEPSFSSAFEITVKDQGATTIFTLGNSDTADGQWCSFIYIGGWRVFQQSQGTKQRVQTFTSGGTWTCPRGVTQALLIGWGGGGGGGGGANGISAASVAAIGGGGGGGSRKRTFLVSVTPGSAYTVTLGAGGGGGGAQTSGNPGTDTTFGSLATMFGAGGGYGSAGTYASSATKFQLGGTPTRTSGYFSSGYPIDYGSGEVFVELESFGGKSIVNGIGYAGQLSPEGFAGGAASSVGTTSFASFGGSGGGGGGGGAGGPGGAGGAGGAGNNTTASVGSPGTAAAANSGAGGGGGGGGGSSNGGTPANGGAGAAGGSGQVSVLWWK